MASREISFNNVCHHAQERPCPHSHARAVFFAFLTPVQKRMCGVRASSRLLLLALGLARFSDHIRSLIIVVVTCSPPPPCSAWERAHYAATACQKAVVGFWRHWHHWEAVPTSRLW